MLRSIGLWWMLALAACVRVPTAPASPASSPPPPRPLTVHATRVEVGREPARAKWRTLVHQDSWNGGTFTGAIDEAGQAWAGWSFWNQTPRWVPFAEPVRELVFFRTQGLQNLPGTRLGPLTCARTVSGKVECVFDLEPRGAELRETWRFHLPFEGEVTRLSVGQLLFGPISQVLCGLTTQGARCWTFDTALTAQQVTLPPADALAMAVGVPPSVVAEWKRAEPAFELSRVQKVVRTDPGDPAKRLQAPPGALVNARVHCALLEGGLLTCFGPGAYGELGDDSLGTTLRASRPLGDARVIDVASISRRVCAVLETGAVNCWGDGRLPYLAKHKPRSLPMCPFDRARSEADYLQKRQAALEASRACAEQCRTSTALDACLGCGPSCTPLTYHFVHQQPCQEPRVDEPTFTTCQRGDLPPRWPTDKELANELAPYELTFSPVPLRGVSDATSLALPGRPEVCVIRRAGALACTDDDDVFRDER